MPGSLPRKSPPQATGGASASTWGTRSGAQRKSSTGHTNRVQQPKSVQHTLKILQWNAEGISPKKLALTYKLRAEKIDIACLQETHLTSKNRFVIRGYQCFRTDRENRHRTRSRNPGHQIHMGWRRTHSIQLLLPARQRPKSVPH